MPTYEIEDIKRLQVKPGEVLLVTVPQGTVTEVAERIKNVFETNLPVRAIVTTGDIHVQVASQDGDDDSVRVR